MARLRFTCSRESEMRGHVGIPKYSAFDGAIVELDGKYDRQAVEALNLVASQLVISFGEVIDVSFANTSQPYRQAQQFLETIREKARAIQRSRQQETTPPTETFENGRLFTSKRVGEYEQIELAHHWAAYGARKLLLNEMHIHKQRQPEYLTGTQRRLMYHTEDKQQLELLQGHLSWLEMMSAELIHAGRQKHLFEV